MSAKIDWELAQNGCEVTIEEIVEKYYRVAYKIALKWTGNGVIDYEDALGLASVALMKCIYSKKYDPDKAEFTTYLGRAVDNEVRMFLRKENRHRKCLSYDTVSQLGESSIVYEFDVENPEEIFEEMEMTTEAYEILQLAKKLMAPLEYASFMYYLTGVPQWVIAEEIDLSQSYVSRLITKAREKLQVAKEQYYAGGR